MKKENFDIILPINDKAYLRFPFPFPPHEILCGDMLLITLHREDGTVFELHPDFDLAISCIQDFYRLITDIPKIAPSITKDIGFLNNDITHGFLKKYDPSICNAQMWATTSPIPNQTFLFEHNNKTFFEVSPMYRKNLNGVTYRRFRQSYKPYALYELGEKTVSIWKKVAEELHRAIYINHDTSCGDRGEAIPQQQTSSFQEE